MKKTLLYTIASISLLATSCQEKHEVEFVDVGSEFFISDSGITSLDEQTTISIKNDQKNISEVEVTHLGGLTTDLDKDDNRIPFTPPSSDLGKITVSDGSGSIDVTDVQLGFDKGNIGWDAFLEFVTEVDGKSIVRSHKITVSDATSFETTGDLVEFKSERDTLFVSVSTANTDITNVVFETKKNDGTMAIMAFDESELKGTSFEGSIALPNDLAYLDSLTGKLSVTSSVRTEVKDFVLYVGGKAFDYSGGGTVSSDTGKEDSYLYVFQPLDADGEPDGDKIMEGMISYANTSGDFAGITSTTVTFKKVGEDDDVANLSELVVFMTGATDKEVTRVAVGEQYAYTFDDAESISHYGVMTITEALTVAVGDALYGFSYSNSSTDKK